MIINTTNIDKDLLYKYGRLLAERLIPDENSFFNVAKPDQYVTVYYSDIIEDGRCIFKFGDCGKHFHLTGNAFDHKLSKDERVLLKSLKGFPKTCFEFRMCDYNIQEIDYLPLSSEYNIQSCKIEKISYPFPEKIDSLYFNKNKITSFENFPKIVEDSLYLEGNAYSTSENFPIVNGSLKMCNNRTLKELNNLKGDITELELENLPKLESINLPKSLKKITIFKCKKLNNLIGLENLDEDCVVYIDDLNNFDPYEILKGKFQLQHGLSFGTKFSNFYFVFYDRAEKGEMILCDDHPKDLTREEFEMKVFNYWTNDVRTINVLNQIEFKTEMVNNKKDTILNSLKGVNKYNL